MREDPEWGESAAPDGAMDDSVRGPGLQSGDLLELEVGAVAYGGAGVARPDGFVVFVPGAYEGERVRAKISRLHSNWAEAELVDVLRPMASRVEPPCPHFRSCGGCAWMDLTAGAQLSLKERHVRESLARIGGIGAGRFHPITPSPGALGYRNKMEFAFAGAGVDLVLGLHASRDPARIEPVGACLLQSETANRILHRVREDARSRGWAAARALAVPAPGGPADSTHSAQAQLRRLVLRSSARGTRCLVVFETTGGRLPGLEEAARALRREIPEVAGVVRVAIVEGRGGGSVATVLDGEGTLVEEVAGLQLEVSAGAFAQVNTGQAERLYLSARELSAVGPGDSMLDLYCGVGGITILLGREAHEALGVEGSAESVRCARANARRNAARGCSFLAGEARRVTSEMVARKRRFSLVVVNPPRVGLHRDIVASIARMEPTRVIYVSCDPATLARDLGRFARRGYTVTDVAPFDMFPQTWHIETVVRLERRK